MKRIIPCVIITLSLIFAGSSLPLFGFIGLVLCPLPLCVMGCIESQKNTSIAELMIEVTLFLAISPTMAVYFLLGCAPVSAFIVMTSNFGFKEVKKLTGGESLLICTGASILFKLILLWAFWFFTGRNILFPDTRQVAEFLVLNYGDKPELMDSLIRIWVILPHVLPAMLVIYAGIETCLNYSLCYRITRRYFPKCKNFPPELPPFTLWKFPVSILMVSFGAFLMNWIFEAEMDTTVSMFIVNLQIAANVIMFVEGLSLAFWIMEGFKLRKGAKILAGFLFLIPFFWPWLIVMGMSDMALDMRERIRFGKKE